MIVGLLLIVIAILLFGAAAVRSAIGTVLALVAGVIVLAFAFSFSATFWIVTGCAILLAALLIAIYSDRQQRKLTEEIWAVYAPFVDQMAPDLVEKATAARKKADHDRMSALLQRGMESRVSRRL